MLRDMSGDLFEIEYENEKGYRILRYRDPKEYLKDERFLSFFDTGLRTGWVAMHIRDKYVRMLTESGFSDEVLEEVIRKNEAGRFYIIP